MFTSNTAEHDAANRRMLQKSAELKTVSAAFVATFVGSGIFRLRLRQSLRQRCKTSTFATGSVRLVRACPKTAPSRLRRILCRNLCRTNRSVCWHFDEVSDEVSDKVSSEARSWDRP